MSQAVNTGYTTRVESLTWILDPSRWGWQEKYKNTLNIAEIYCSVRPDSKIRVCTQRAWKRNLTNFELFFPFSFYWQQTILKTGGGWALEMMFNALNQKIRIKERNKKRQFFFVLTSRFCWIFVAEEEYFEQILTCLYQPFFLGKKDWQTHPRASLRWY